VVQAAPNLLQGEGSGCWQTTSSTDASVETIRKTSRRTKGANGPEKNIPVKVEQKSSMNDLTYDFVPELGQEHVLQSDVDETETKGQSFIAHI
jgi:hypothetical protein